jgi:hypothetical protein
MSSQADLHRIAEQIRAMKKAAENLSPYRECFPALDKNTRRILASIKMLELNVSDIVELEG